MRVIYTSMIPSIPTDSGLPTKPTQLSQQDLFYSYRKDETAVLTCNVQSTPPPAFRCVGTGRLRA